jgi:hypothetical protein
VDSPSGRPDSRSNGPDRGHHTPTTLSPSLRDPSRDLFLDIQALVDGDDRKYGASIHRRHDSAVTAGPTYQPAANGQDRMPRLLQTVPHRERTAKDAAVEVRQTASSVNRVQKIKEMQQQLPERLPVEAYNNDCGNSHSGDGNPNCISNGKSHNSTVNIDNNNSVINSSNSNNNASSCNGSANYYDISNVNSGSGFKTCNGGGVPDNSSSHNGVGHNNGSGYNGSRHNSSGHNSSGHNSNSHNHSSGHNSTNRHVVNFSIEKRKRIELTSLEPNSSSSALLMPASPHITLESVTTASPIHNSSSNNSSMYTESPRKGEQSSYQEYFDNLISLIDEAAGELSV